MIIAQSGEMFLAELIGAPTGQVGSLTFEIIDPPSTVVLAETTLEISESTEVEGAYSREQAAPVVPVGEESHTYWVVWDNGGLAEPVVEDLYVTVVAVEATELLPDVKAVAGVLRARTYGERGSEAGTFTSATTPTADQVVELIKQAGDDVAMEIGTDIPLSVRGMARSTVAIGAAMLVELSFFPEQVATGRSPYDQLERMYTRKLKSLTAAVAEAESGGIVPAGASILPTGTFDPAPRPEEEIW